MSTPTPSSPEKEAPKSLDWDAAEKHLKAIKEKTMSYLGKGGHNPAFYWRKKGEGLEKRFARNVRTPEFYMEVMALKFEVPTVDVTAPLDIA